MKRRQFISLLGGAAAASSVSWPTSVRAQRGAMPVVGLLSTLSPGGVSNRLRAFHRGLSDAGYVDGRNVRIEYQWAEDRLDRLPALAADLVRRQVDVIAAIGGPASGLAAQEATKSIPIVFQVGVDPVQIGLVGSLSRPGSNITGVTSLNTEVGVKRLELLHEVVPTAATIALLVNPSSQILTAITIKDTQAAAQLLGIEIQIMRGSTDPDFDSVFSTLVQSRLGAIVISPDGFFIRQSARLAELAIRHRVPAISPYREFVEAGGLMSYGGNIADSWRLAGVYTGRVLKGDKPADLPVQQSTKVELIINLKTANALGLDVPQMLLARADEVIE
jgi:putative ABC transport system substrate-binding protein